MCNDKSFPIDLSLKGQIETINLTTTSSVVDVYHFAAKAFEKDESTLKILYKGKRLDSQSTAILFPKVPTTKKPKIMVLSTSSETIQAVSSRRADPTIRGLDQEIQRDNQKAQQKNLHQEPLIEPVWGSQTAQHKNFKFVKLQACKAHEFGTRTTDSSPHPFRAKALLDKLATDPGVKAVMISRELVVNTLGEMDPIDDRIMQKQEAHGGCLLGYNTNHGLRIDVKLRTDDLSDFRPYPQLVQTLLHELSHNWVGEHNLLFWTNYGNLRLEYLYTHLHNTEIIQGHTTRQIAGLPSNLKREDLYQMVLQELVQDMRQHGLHPNMIAPALEQTCRQLESELTISQGSTLSNTSSNNNKTARELALEAAEKRRRDHQQDE